LRKRLEEKKRIILKIESTRKEKESKRREMESTRKVK